MAGEDVIKWLKRVVVTAAKDHFGVKPETMIIKSSKASVSIIVLTHTILPRNDSSGNPTYKCSREPPCRLRHMALS